MNYDGWVAWNTNCILGGNEMVNDVQNRNEQLDQEWIDLILEAVELGISVQDIQNFLQTKTA